MNAWSATEKTTPKTAADQERLPVCVPETTSSGGARKRTPSQPLPVTPLSCNTDWGTGQLLPAVGTTAHPPKNCTKRSHCNRFDACMALRVALVSVPEWAVAPEWAPALVWATKAL